MGKVPPFVGRFLIGFGRSERKYAFSALGNTNKSTFSNFCELFAPRLLPHLNITVRNIRNLYFFWYRLIFIQLRSWVAFIHRYVASFHPKVQISDVPDFTFINKIDLPNFRGCLNNWRYHSGGSFAIFEHAPLLLPTANCSPPTFCEFP